MRDNALIESKYSEWTSMRGRDEAILSVFEHIRDIPYAVLVRHLTLDKGPGGMIKDGKGSCAPKHYLMGHMYERMGLDVRYCSYTFSWDAIGVDYPESIQAIGKNIPDALHLACEVRMRGKWVLVDATWDMPLAAAGFSVNLEWDGESDTVLAVDPREKFVHNNAEERDRFFLEKASGYSLADKLEFSRFSIALNKWLEEVRQHKAE